MRPSGNPATYPTEKCMNNLSATTALKQAYANLGFFKRLFFPRKLKYLLTDPNSSNEAIIQMAFQCPNWAKRLYRCLKTFFIDYQNEKTKKENDDLTDHIRQTSLFRDNSPSPELLNGIKANRRAHFLRVLHELNTYSTHEDFDPESKNRLLRFIALNCEDMPNEKIQTWYALTKKWYSHPLFQAHHLLNILYHQDFDSLSSAWEIIENDNYIPPEKKAPTFIAVLSQTERSCYESIMKYNHTADEENFDNELTQHRQHLSKLGLPITPPSKPRIKKQPEPVSTPSSSSSSNQLTMGANGHNNAQGRH